MSDSQNRQASIDSRRIALEREIVIRLPAFDNFVTEYSTNLSTTGMFVLSENPQPPGTSFAFEFSVADDWKLIRGKGSVVWARYSAESPERPPGMGIRFTELDAQSRRLIRWVVEKHIREGGVPFELEELKTEVEKAIERAQEDEDDTPAAPASASVHPAPTYAAAEKSGGDRSWGLLALLLSGAAVVALVAGILWMSEPDQPAAEAAPPRRAAVATPPAETASAAPAETAAPRSPDLAAVPELVTRWSRDWASQRPDSYVEHYSSTFEPPNGLSRAAWETIRTERLTTPDSIAIGITALETNPIEPGRVEVEFTQAYRSDLLADVVRKRFELVWEGDGWKIASEEVVAILE